MCKEIPLHIIFEGYPLELIRVETLPSNSISVLEYPVEEFFNFTFRVVGSRKKIYFLLVLFTDQDFFLTDHSSISSVLAQLAQYHKTYQNLNSPK
jgi:hypothetical protein